MATFSYADIFSHQQPSHLSIDTRRVDHWNHDADSEILDEHILDNGLDSSIDAFSPLEPMRRHSEEDNNFILSPHEWTHDTFEVGQARSPASAMPGSYETNPYVKMEGASNPFGASTWGSGAAAAGTYQQSQPASVFEAHSAPFVSSAPHEAYMNPGTEFASHMAQPMSASSTIHRQDQWASVNGGMDHGEMSRPLPKRARSPITRPTTPQLRGNGIRKKNARFEIPQERTLTTIDDMISKSTDDGEIKELKQQKRLLRNRQAALDSRQRKKQHTERLEEEKKHSMGLIQELEDKVEQLRLEREEFAKKAEEWDNEKNMLTQRLYYANLQHEEQLHQHTQETRDLRKRAANYEQQIHQMTEEMMRLQDQQPAPQSTFDDFDIDHFAWTQAGFDQSMFPQANEHRMVDALVERKPDTKALDMANEDKPAASGLLLILLLMGAFVTSKSGSFKQLLPPVPKSLQTESAKILGTLFQDAGVTDVANMPVVTDVTHDAEWVTSNSIAPHMISLSNSMSSFGDSVKVAPSFEQERSELGMPTALEYQDATTKSFSRQAEASSRGKQNLDKNLASMRISEGSAAEVYTRSLLWDKVDAEVVRRFAVFAQQAAAQQATAAEDGPSAPRQSHRA